MTVLHIAFLTATLVCDNFGLALPPANFELSLECCFSSTAQSKRILCTW